MAVQFLELARQEGVAAGGRGDGIGDVLTVGFGTTVGMWAVGYVGHMPLTGVHASVFVSLMLGCMVVGGFVAGRYTRRPMTAAVWGGVVSATLNLLILGSVIAEEGRKGGISGGAVWAWVPGSYGVTVGLMALGALAGRRFGAAEEVRRRMNWRAGLAWVTCGATLLLICAGGLVTGFRSGLAVPDWPNSYGSNMFLLPLSKMSGGTFYEHAHRLLGSLVGFAALTLAVYVSAVDRRWRSMVPLAWGVGLCVMVQGVLGGLRVTKTFTLSQAGIRPDDFGPNVLAVVHGTFAHYVLGGLVAVAVLATRTWRGAVREDRPGASTDQVLATALVGLVMVQTMLGAFVRQMNWALLAHITVAVLAVLLGLGVGMRAWGLNARGTVLRRVGVGMMVILGLQVVLGIVAVAYRTPPVERSALPDLAGQAGRVSGETTALQAVLTTLHQTNAALLLAAGVMVMLWSWRLLREVGGGVSDVGGD